MNSENKNYCENCKHYIQHYYWREGELKKTCSGHCTSYRRMRLVMTNSYCNKWELSENISTPSNESLEKILRRTVKQIDDIAAILKIDN